MNRLLISSLSALALVAAVTGCKKEAETAKPAAGGGTPPAAAAPTTPAAAAAATADDVVGKWQAVNVEADPGFPEGLRKELLTGKMEVRPDHTYVASNNAAGRSNGTWAVSGATLTLTPAATQTLMKPVVIAVEKPRLANRNNGLAIVFERTGPASAAAAEPKFKLTAAAFMDEVKKDEAAAVAKYNEAPVEVSGYVTSLDAPASGTYVFVAGPPPAGKSVSDLFLGLKRTPADAEVWGTVGPRQKVKVVGVALVGKGYAELGEAKFTPDGPSILKSTTAEELAADFAKDADATKKKYTGDAASSVLLTGAVLEKQINDGRESVLILGKGDAKVRCEHANGGNDVKKVLEPIKVGQTVKLAGQYSAYATGMPKLDNCMLVTK